MKTKLVGFGLAALLAAGAGSWMAIPAGAASSTGCAAPAGSSCTFTGGSSAQSGIVDLSNASWTITTGTTTVYSGSAPGVTQATFTPNTVYTLTVGAGQGVVAAGSGS